MTEPGTQQLSDLGETGVVDRILGRIGVPDGALVAGGDDAAVVAFGGEGLLLTIDELVEQVDFDFAYCSGADVGWKAIAVNASDIAAMCGRPLWAIVSLAVPPGTAVNRLDQVVEGMLEAASRWGIGLIGGDLSRAPEVSVTVAMAGRLVAVDPVLRSGAVAGDSLCVTGSLGGAAAGLRLLRAEGAVQDQSVRYPGGQRGETHGAAAELVRRQLRPVARVEQSEALAPLQPSSMIDLSDGLAPDLTRLMKASVAGCVVNPDALPLDDGLEAVVGSDRGSAFELAMVGGEDFELLFTIEPGSVDAAISAVEHTGVSCTQIGHIVDGDCRVGDKALSSWEEVGWDHLRNRS
jgi:thiamine-monophosphate kinase